jgi:F-type H+-transporting ATPase subunit alpha
VLPFEKGLHAFFHQNYAELMKKIVSTGDWNNDIEASFKAGLDEYKKTGSW